MARTLSINKFLVFLILSFFCVYNQAFGTGSGITYNGRLLDPSGNAVTSSNVQFRIQIRTPGNENCLMYEEIQTKDMTNSDGIFSITINDGTGSRTDSTGYALDQIFANRGSFTFTSGYCAVGTTYNTSPADGRKLQVYFNDGSFATGQWEPTPAMAINFIPMAIESQQVGGYKKEQLLKIADGVSTTGTELDTTKWTNLLALINGTSTAYTKPTDQVTQLYGATVPTPANGQSIRWNSALNAGAGGWENFTAGTASAVTTVSSANADIAVANGSTTPQLTLNSGTGANQIVKLDGTAKLPAVDGSALTNVNASKVGGTSVSLASLANGQVLKYNGTNWANASDADTLGGLSCANGRVAYYTGGSWACLEVTSTSAINTIVSRDGTGESVFGSLNTGTLKINDGSTGTISLTTPVAVTNYSMRLPATVGSAGQVLTTDGGSPAQLSWLPMNSSQWTTTGSDIYYNTGKVGIGVNNPGAPLTVQGSANGGVYSIFDATTVYNGSYKLASFRSGGAEYGYISPGQIYMNDNNNAAGSNANVTVRGVAATPNIYGSAFNGNRIGVYGFGGGTAAAGAGVVGQGSSNPAMISESLGTNADSFITTSKTMTTGRLALFEHNTSAYSGDALLMNLANGSGSFTGNFLNFKNNGSSVMVVNSTGNVAIGRSTASAKLDVQGQIVSRSYDNGSGVAFDMNNGNAQYTSASCGAMTMSNLVDGASYSLVVQGATSGTCTFTASGYTFRFNPANGPTTASTHTIYSMQVIGTIVYVSWITGF